jgi:hypothetical protein
MMYSCDIVVPRTRDSQSNELIKKTQREAGLISSAVTTGRQILELRNKLFGPMSSSALEMVDILVRMTGSLNGPEVCGCNLTSIPLGSTR